MTSRERPPSITATCPQCRQTVPFTPDPNKLGPSGRDLSNLWICSNHDTGYVAEYSEFRQ